jgi:hypothetical protein
VSCDAQRIRTAATERVSAAGETFRLGRALSSNRWVVTWDGAEQLSTYRYVDLDKRKSDTRAGRTSATCSSCCGKPPRVGAPPHRG